jgi:hypothetical protein
VYQKSTQLCDTLGIPYWRLVYLLQARRVPKPNRDSSGDYLWSPAEIEAVRRALASQRQRKAVVNG